MCEKRTIIVLPGPSQERTAATKWILSFDKHSAYNNSHAVNNMQHFKEMLVNKDWKLQEVLLSYLHMLYLGSTQTLHTRSKVIKASCYPHCDWSHKRKL